MMKKISVLFIWITVITIFSPSGCGHDNNQESGNEQNIMSSTDIDYVSGYTLTLDDLVDNADLIVIGTVTGTVGVVPHETLKEVWQTKSSFHIEKSFKGDYSDEIIVIQTGVVGKEEYPNNPIFEVGEQCFLFLTKGTDGIYRLVDLHGRLRIKDGRVSSMSYFFRTEESRPPDDLKFWNADLNFFISKVMDAVKS